MAHSAPPPYDLRTLSEEETDGYAEQPDHTPVSDTQHHRLSAGYTYNVRRTSQSPRGLAPGSPSHKRGRHPQISSSPEDLLPLFKPDYFTGRAANQLGTSPTPGPGGRRQSESVMGDGSHDASRSAPSYVRPLPPIFPLASSGPSGANPNPSIHPNAANATRNRRVSFADELTGPQSFTSRPALGDRTAASNRKVDPNGGPDKGILTQKASSETSS